MCPKGSQEWEETWKSLEKGELRCLVQNSTPTGIIAFNELAVILDKNGSADQNPYVMGKTFSYADIAISTALYTFRKHFPAEWEDVSKWNNGRWGLLAEKCSAFATET